MAPSLLLLVVFSSSLLVLLPSPSVCAPGPQGAGSDNGDDDGDSVLATYVGSFRNYDHGIAGDVFVVDAKTLFIKDFSYDGDGPDAFFWASGTRRASSRGVIIPYPAGQNPPKKLGKYDKKDVILRLPGNVKVTDMKNLSVWCRAFAVNFGDMVISQEALQNLDL